MINTRFSYIGLFLNRNELQEKLKEMPGRTPLEHEYPTPHVTFAYHPDEFEEKLFGVKAFVTAMGYGCDGRNEGLKVTVQSDDPLLVEAYRRIRVPHITLSLSPEGEAVDTGNLIFHSIEPFTLHAVFGGYDRERGRVVTSLSCRQGE